MDDMVLSPYMVTEQAEPEVLSQLPDQLPKWERRVGLLIPVAVSVTGVPSANCAEQTPELPVVQAIPVGELFTDPLPLIVNDSWRETDAQARDIPQLFRIPVSPAQLSETVKVHVPAAFMPSRAVSGDAG